MEDERQKFRIERFKDEGIREEYKQKVTEALNTEWKCKCYRSF